MYRSAFELITISMDDPKKQDQLWPCLQTDGPATQLTVRYSTNDALVDSGWTVQFVACKAFPVFWIVHADGDQFEGRFRDIRFIVTKSGFRDARQTRWPRLDNSSSANRSSPGFDRSAYRSDLPQARHPIVQRFFCAVALRPTWSSSQTLVAFTGTFSSKSLDGFEHLAMVNCLHFRIVILPT